ncbi:hypothetical protein RJ641_003836 [Dillenia turbinata]|uniref:Uncharacterized protein n=1 Tax=Dillenia turbinata TaxID=194707 RepID=A0AAN8VLV4_9MAGN
MSHARRILTPGASRKRKERDDAFYAVKTPLPLVQQLSGVAQAAKSVEPVSSNRLLAGYMAHEFLTKGTLFGQKFDPAGAAAMPVSSPSAELKKKPSVGNQKVESGEPSGRRSAEAGAETKPVSKSYADVAGLLKSDGAHIPGIVNPTQLARRELAEITLSITLPSNASAS